MDLQAFTSAIRLAAIAGDAGGASIEDQSHKMANTADRNKQLRKAYIR